MQGGDGLAVRFFWSLPGGAQGQLCPRQRYIAALGALAAWTAMAVWRERLQGRRVLWAVDNLCALGSFACG